MLHTAAGSDKILSGVSALYVKSAELQEKAKEHLESLCCACLKNVKLEQLEMWSVRIKAAAMYTYMHICIHVYATYA